jgi:hypothetical protein
VLGFAGVALYYSYKKGVWRRYSQLGGREVIKV